MTDLVAVARAEIGYVESGRNRTKYGEWYPMNGVSWCSIFVAWTLWRCGLDVRHLIPGYPSSQTALNGWKRLGKTVAPKDIRPGDVVFYHVPGEHAGANHTGIATSTPYLNGGAWYVMSCDGNTAVHNVRSGGGVEEKPRLLSWVVGAARPLAGVVPVPVAPPVAAPVPPPVPQGDDDDMMILVRLTDQVGAFPPGAIFRITNETWFHLPDAQAVTAEQNLAKLTGANPNISPISGADLVEYTAHRTDVAALNAAAHRP